MSMGGAFSVSAEALCDAFLLDRLGIGPYIIFTSHKPLPGSSSEAMMSVAGKVVFDLIGINDDEDMDRLKGYADGPLPRRSKVVAKRQRVQEEMKETTEVFGDGAKKTITKTTTTSSLQGPWKSGDPPF